MINMKIRDFQHSGQTLIEAVVALSIMLVLITGLVAATTMSLKAAQSTRIKSQATKLTQEGIESIRNIRDAGWNNFFALNPTGTSIYCLNNPPDLSFTVNDPVIDCAENIAITEGNLNFKFTRFVKLTWDDSNPPGMQVIVRVKYSDGSSIHESNAETKLTNWK